MPAVRVAVAADWPALRTELQADEAFPPAALTEAERAAAAPDLPARDLTDVPFLTVDPEGSRDLDQALSLRRTGRGYELRYAIADVGAFVRPGSALDLACRARGVTLYFPDERVPLHPHVLGEGAASLLEDQQRPALVWTVDLDADGEPGEPRVERALVRSRRRLTYAGVQAALDGGSADEQLLLLREVGRLRQERARDRGAVDLPVPDQEVQDGPDGPVLALRAPLPVEAWNAQLSLLTGVQAARLMVDGGVGLLRTLPPPAPEDVAAVRRSALALDVAWPEGTAWGDVVRDLDPAVPAHAALLTTATRLLRGAGYLALDGVVPDEHQHSAVAAAYAHCTAPLRRYADRWVGETCLALAAGDPVPDAVREVLPLLPEVMARAGQRASTAERAVVDLAEAVLLAPRVGEVLEGAVVAVTAKGGTVQLRDPAVLAPCEGVDLPLGERLQVRVVRADPASRSVLLQPAGPGS